MAKLTLGAPQPVFTRNQAAWALLGLAVFGAGCDHRPSAPPLQNTPTYWDQEQGFRFSVPDGWRQRARGAAPSGKITSERMLTEYKCLTCARPAVLMVSVADVPLATPLKDYVLKSTLTGEKWQPGPPPEEFTINGEPAVRITSILRAGKAANVREIIAFRRGERVYFFKGYYDDADTRSRSAIRAAVDTIVW